MNGVHDMGGMEGFGRVIREENEPLFHHDWERRMIGIGVLAGFLVNPDEFRHAIERITPADYLTSSYYERWMRAVEGLYAEKGISGGNSELVTVATVAASGSRKSTRGKFIVGDRVRARVIHPPGHTRLPQYVRGRRGRVTRDLGEKVFPDTNAHHAGENRQHVYTVEFSASELFGADRNPHDTVRLDLWEDYLERDKSVTAEVT
jgi:nitrile hydratase subunit beta